MIPCLVFIHDELLKDYLHKLSTHIISENQTIVIEDLRISNMLKNYDR